MHIQTPSFRYGGDKGLITVPLFDICISHKANGGVFSNDVDVDLWRIYAHFKSQIPFVPTLWPTMGCRELLKLHSYARTGEAVITSGCNRKKKKQDRRWNAEQPEAALDP